MNGNYDPNQCGNPIESAWGICSDIYSEILGCRSASIGREIESEMIFCLLGGFGVTYELCISAADLVSEMDPFAHHWSESRLFDELTRALNSPQFDPPRRDGSRRKYRFPVRKARLIVNARKWIHSHGSIAEALWNLENSHLRRQLLCRCPGIGPKTASWILRNLGIGNDLAILDVHVVRAMQDCGRIGPVQLPRDYEFAESAFLNWCSDLEANPAAFDMFVWDWQRGSL